MRTEYQSGRVSLGLYRGSLAAPVWLIDMANRSLIHQMEARERRGRWFPALAGLLSIALLGSTWVGLFTFLGANSAYGTVDKVRAEYVPDVDTLSLVLPDLSRVSRVYSKGGASSWPSSTTAATPSRFGSKRFPIC